MSNSNLCRIALLQLCCDAHLDNNLEKGIRMLRKVKQENPDVQMMFLPECTDFMPQIGTRPDNSSNVMRLIERYRDEARSLNTWISLGGVHFPASPSKSTISHLILKGGTGEIVCKYDKLHLFQLDEKYNEKKYNIAGDKIPHPCMTPAGLLGPCICFDIRFPQLAYIYRRMGADILTYPSAFTRITGEANHWHVLLRARAIENQCYVLAAAQCGNDTYGHSCVIDPWGKVISELASNEEGYCTAYIDRNLIKLVRDRIPMKYKNDIYSLYSNKCLKVSTLDQFKFGDKTVLSDQIFFQSKHSIAFVNIHPVVDRHVLVSSKRRVQYLRDLSNEERDDIIQSVNVIVKAISKNGTNIVIQDGPEAGQTIPHLHFHILPRTGKEFVADNDDLYRELEKHDKEDRKSRSLTEMKLEATELSKLFHDL